MDITGVRIYGLEESIAASGYPFRTETNPDKLLTEKDLSRAEKLGQAKAGSGHDNFLKGIVVQFDLQASLKLWPQLQRYHFIEFVSSQSTMHCASKFDISSSCNDYVDRAILARVEELKQIYLDNPNNENYLTLLYNLPNGFEFTARLSTNYLQLKTVYEQRRHHRLPEWKMICDWIESLPHSEWLTRQK